MIDTPEGTALETTARVASVMASATLMRGRHRPALVSMPAPYNFNGLVRHYLRRAAPRRYQANRC
jgi:hypothetical protein